MLGRYHGQETSEILVYNSCFLFSASCNSIANQTPLLLATRVFLTYPNG
jgi:hypothetical protein